MILNDVMLLISVL